jgi:hypothetical protein
MPIGKGKKDHEEVGQIVAVNQFWFDAERD